MRYCTRNDSYGVRATSDEKFSVPDNYTEVTLEEKEVYEAKYQEEWTIQLKELARSVSDQAQELHKKKTIVLQKLNLSDEDIKVLLNG